MNKTQVGLLGGVALAVTSVCAAEQNGWRSLFDDKLSSAVFDPSVWSKDAAGCLTAEKDVAIWTRDDYSRFELSCEYNLEPAGNSGILIYCSDTEKWIPNAVEIQLIDNDAPKWKGLDPKQANLAFFGHQAPTSNPAKPAGEWNSIKVRADGSRLSVTLNGVLVNECDLSLWTDAKKLPNGEAIPPWLSRPWAELKTAGKIGLQGRHAGAGVRFRNVRIRPLSPLAMAGDPDADQVNEAAAVFEGKIPAKMRGGTWKVVYSSAEGPEGRALEVLTERIGQHLLREGHLATSMVLPLEKDGGEKVETKRDVVVIGRPSQNATLRKCLKGEDAPKGGYLVKSMHENGRNVVLLAGDTPEAVLWAAFDFLDVVAPTLEAKMSGMHGRYVGTFFRGGKIPAFECRRVPQTPVRSVFSWGHVVDDYRASFREMARARFNRAILWNDQLVVNAREVVECARSWGVMVYWGFSWGWTLSGNDGKDLDFGKLADDIVDEWRRKWKPMGGDGIYFQSFTETDKREIGGRSIPEAVTELVNAVSARIHAEAPDVDIVFGLHSNSMKREGAGEAIAKVDPSLEILWENCGGFPFWEAEGKESSPDVAFCDRILALNPSVGLAWKAQLRIDWGNYVPPAGPFVLGCAGERLRDRDRSVTAPRQWSFDEDWILNGANAHEFVRHVRAGKRPPKEFNAVAEYNPPYSFATHCQAELFWNSDDDWEEIAKRARLRARPER